MPLAPGQIATLVIGPQAGGRGYQILARSDGPRLSADAEGRLNDLALVLAGWADQAEAPAVALIPLADATVPAVLLRIAYLGAASLGTSAFAHGLLLDETAFADCGGRPDLLLPTIPGPDGTRDFGQQPLTLMGSVYSPPMGGDWAGLGLEWRDRLVLTSHAEEEEPVLASILAALGPAGPGARVRGWATTALLPSSGGFSPARDLQLLVLGPQRRRPERSHYFPARATLEGFEGERIAPSESAKAWQRLRGLGANDGDFALALAPLRWSPDDFDKPAIEVAGPAARDVMLRLDGGEAQMRFILALARPRREPLDADFAAVARGLFAQLIEQPGLAAQHKAFFIRALTEAPAETVAAMLPLGRLLLAPGSLAWIRGMDFARLVQLGYIEALVAEPERAKALLDGAGPDELSLIIDRLLSSHAEQERPPALVTEALRRLADHGADADAPHRGELFAAGLRWRLREAAGEDESRLGARSVVQATYRFARPMMAPLARRALRLRDRRDAPDQMGAAEKMDVLGGALEWIRLEGAAA